MLRPAHLKGIEPSAYRSTGGCSTIELQMQVVRTDGVEPSLRVYQTRVLTIVLRPSGQPGNRTPLSQFAKLACHLNVARGRAGFEPDPSLCRRGPLQADHDSE